MKLKLILFQSLLRFRLLATILHPPIGAASSPTSRLDGKARNALIGKAFKFVLNTGCHGTDGHDDDAPDDDAVDDEVDDKDDIWISGIQAPATAKLK